MSSTLAYYRRYPRDFLEGASGLGFEVKNAYSTILDLIYIYNGALPDNPQMIAGQLECSVRKWNLIREKLIEAGKIRVETGTIRNFRADKEEITRRSFADNQAIKSEKGVEKRREISRNQLTQKEMALYAGQPVGSTTGQPAEEAADQPYSESESYKSSSSAGACARDLGFSEEAPDPLLRRVAEAVGLSGAEFPRFWVGDQAATHVRAWLSAHGLTEDEVVAEAARSQSKFDGPPDGPKALDRWMEQVGAAKRSASGVRSNLPATAAAPGKPPASPIDRLTFFADWINDPAKPLPPNTISNTLRDALLNAKMVTPETLRARGIR